MTETNPTIPSQSGIVPDISVMQAKALHYLQNCTKPVGLWDTPEPVGAVTLKTLAARGMVTVAVSITPKGRRQLGEFLRRHPDSGIAP